jgi:hypothetical protein
MVCKTVAHVIEARVLKPYRLRLTFKNGVEKIVNLDPILRGPIFGPLRNPKRFKEVTVDKDFGCIEWPNGADICPDALYEGQLIQWEETFSPEERAKMNKLCLRYNRTSGKEKQKILEHISEILRSTGSKKKKLVAV